MRSSPTSKATDSSAAAARDVLDLLQTTRLPERLIELAGDDRPGRRAPRPSATRARRCARSRSRSSPRATASSCRSCSPASRRPTPRPRIASRRSTSRTCSSARASCCASNDAIREVEQLRFRSIMVDEFQDTNSLQTDLIDLLCAGPPKELFFVGDEFQSIYGFRHADVAVFRDRREAAPQRAAADAQLPLAARGARRGQRAVRRASSARASRSSTPAAGVRRPGASGRRSSCSSRTRRRTRTRVSTGAAPRRGTLRAASASSSTRAPRRPARSSSSSPPGPTPSGSRRSCARSTCRRSG